VAPTKIQPYELFEFFPCGSTAKFWTLAASMKLSVSYQLLRRSRTVGRTPRTGNQLVSRSLLPAPGDCDDGEVGGMNSIGSGNRSTQRKPAPTTLCPPQIPLARPGPNPGRSSGKPALPMARPPIIRILLSKNVFKSI
jgi:hypothetical protein